MPRPLIALLSDFGTRDHYVGTMKGVALGICGEAAFVDITHEVPPQDILTGALELAAAYAYFPSGTIFLVVIDPGVGSARRAIAVAAAGYRFVAPDNGVLTAVLDAHAPVAAVELTEPRYARATVSRTFEGRDRFAPAAAWLAAGVALTALGRPAGALHRLDIPRPQLSGSAISGEVLRVDRFGNLITNVDRATVAQVAASGALDVRIAAHAVGGIVGTYADVAPGAVCALFGSSDHLEIAVSGGSATDTLGMGRGAPVHISRRA